MKYLRVLVGLFFIAFNPGAIADQDDRSFPGALCQPETNTLAISRDSVGRMFNTSTAPQNWTCPITRDSFTEPDNVEFAAVTVIDNNNDAGVSLACTLFSRSVTGGFVASAFDASPDGTSNLEYGAGNANAVSNVNPGYYYFRCSIPATDGGLRSGIVSYRITENVEED